ncbi:MAG: hypothetical protein U1F35_03940 [Steroidobacteraceae bacterium]
MTRTPNSPAGKSAACDGLRVQANMDKKSACDLRHTSRERRSNGRSCALLAILLPAIALIGACSSGTSGHAPGLAGGQIPDPVTLDYPLAYVKRSIPQRDIDVRDLIRSTAGGDLYVRDKASASGVETNITKDITQGQGDVKDLDVSPEGTSIVFSLRLPLLPNATDDQQPTWNVWEYDAKAKVLRRVIQDDITAEKGHDVSPHYLPDGRIVFSSTRQNTSRAILLDEGRPQYAAQTDDRQRPAFLLHVMNADGSDIHQISFNTNHDFAPSVLNNGQIVFSRWDRGAGGDRINLYRANPDGTGMELYYGQYSHATGTNNSIVQFLNARTRPDNQLLVLTRPFLGTQQGGDITKIDGERFVEINQTTLAAAGTPGPGQLPATTVDVSTVADQPSLGGRFASAFPLFDGTNRMLVSWSPCFVLDASVTPAATKVCDETNTAGANVQLAPPQYTIWVYDLDTNTLRPMLPAEEGKMIVDPVILQQRTPAPPVIRDKVPGVDVDKNLAAEGAGLLVIRSVYDFDGIDTARPSIAAMADPKQTTADQRPDRFVRVEKPVSIPDRMVRDVPGFAFGPAGLGMREILAYAPVEPDGSIKIKVPANVPFAISVLDRNGRRVGQRHGSWLQLLPGEVRTCSGCHDANKQTAHGRDGLSTSVNAGAATTGQPFPNTDPAMFADFGEIMAETRARISCASAAGCSMIPSANLIYDDVWTDPVAAGRAKDASFAYLYSDLTTPAPINGNCLPTWSGRCRITIHYLQHLQPMWNTPRQTLAADGVTVLTDHTCILCHNTRDAAATTQVPAGQLDLTDGVSNADPNVVTSYEQLLFAHDQQELIMGALQDVMVNGPVDPVTGLPTQVPVVLPGSMNAGSAGASTAFFSRFDTGGSHAGWLSPAELKMIAEWLDIGAQYYNDPFVAPAN